jgi:hypothetical protein
VYTLIFAATQPAATCVSVALGWLATLAVLGAGVFPALIVVATVCELLLWPALAPGVYWIPVLGPAVARAAAQVHWYAAEGGGAPALNGRLRLLALPTAAGAAAGLPQGLALLLGHLPPLLSAATARTPPPRSAWLGEPARAQLQRRRFLLAALRETEGWAWGAHAPREGAKARAPTRALATPTESPQPAPAPLPRTALRPLAPLAALRAPPLPPAAAAGAAAHALGGSATPRALTARLSARLPPHLLPAVAAATAAQAASARAAIAAATARPLLHLSTANPLRAAAAGGSRGGGGGQAAPARDAVTARAAGAGGAMASGAP